MSQPPVCGTGGSEIANPNVHKLQAPAGARPGDGSYWKDCRLHLRPWLRTCSARIPPCGCDASEASQPERGWEGGRCSPGGVPLCWPHPLSRGPSAAPSPQEVTQAPSRAPASPPPAAATSVPVTQACGRLPAQTRRGGMSPRAVPVSGGLWQARPQHPLCRGPPPATLPGSTPLS